ncbi:TolC family protein [Puniceicoccales bacterium CK1056]|uniref:TolC family protein n=1 Tax=Oceanipulchritudo coccoides TaxID=2706888 RepID=A0A6B2M2Q5_9BACT|nr:TolC family protein [Oceanipulchritudo coccoides]NDV62357.1 TolC family protein [Oceanipulchritudo coccoides]
MMSPRFPVLFLSLFLCTGLFAKAPIPFAEELFPELKELMTGAAMDSPGLRLLELRVEERAGDLDVAIAQNRPSARLNARLLGNYDVRDDIDNDFRGDLSAGVTINQPLYQWGNLKRRVEVARQRLELEGVEYENQGSRQFMQLREAYLNWILMRERRRITRQSIELSESFVAARRQLLEAGQSSEQDVLEMEARLLENRESLAFAEKSIRNQEDTLSRLSGISIAQSGLKGAPLTLIEPMSSEEFAELQASVRQSLGGVSDPLQSRWEILEQIEDEQLAMLDKRNWPFVDLVAGAFTDQLDSINQQDSVTRVRFYAGLQVNWNIFDSWQTDGYKRSTLARKRAYALRKEEASDDFSRQVDSLLAEIQLNLKQIEARGKRESLLDRRVTLLRQQAERNLITGIDLIEGEINYLNVQQWLMEARVQYLMNLMRLGVLLDMDPAAAYYTPQS